MMKIQVEQTKKAREYSKQLVSDIRALLWSGMVGLPWAAHGTVCSFYLSLCKSDHSEGGITFEAAKAAGFQQREGSIDSPAI